MTLTRITKTLSGVIFYLDCALALLMLFLGTVGMFVFFACAAAVMYCAYRLFGKMEEEQLRQAKELDESIRILERRIKQNVG